MVRPLTVVFADYHADGTVCPLPSLPSLLSPVRYFLGHALRPTPDTLQSPMKIVTARRRGK